MDEKKDSLMVKMMVLLIKMGLKLDEKKVRRMVILKALWKGKKKEKMWA